MISGLIYSKIFKHSLIVSSASMWVLFVVAEVCDSHDLAGSSGVGMHLLQNFVTPPTFFLVIDRGLGY